MANQAGLTRRGDAVARALHHQVYHQLGAVFLVAAHNREQHLCEAGTSSARVNSSYVTQQAVRAACAVCSECYV